MYVGEMPISLEHSYFEIEILDMGVEGAISIGEWWRFFIKLYNQYSSLNAYCDEDTLVKLSGKLPVYYCIPK